MFLNIVVHVWLHYNMFMLYLIPLLHSMRHPYEHPATLAQPRSSDVHEAALPNFHPISPAPPGTVDNAIEDRSVFLHLNVTHPGRSDERSFPGKQARALLERAA